MQNKNNAFHGTIYSRKEVEKTSELEIPLPVREVWTALKWRLTNFTDLPSSPQI